VECIEQYFITNEIKEDKQVAVMLNGKQNVWITTQFGHPSQGYHRNTTEAIVTETNAHSRAIPLSQRNQLKGETVSTYFA